MTETKIMTNEIKDANVTAAKLVNPYKARAYRSADVAFADATWTKIALNAETYDTNNNFDSTTNFRYVAPVTGYYQVNGCANVAATTIGTTNVGLYIDGSLFIRGDFNTTGDSQKAMTVSDVIYMAANSYVELWLYADATSGSNLLQGDSTKTYMSIHLLSI